MNYLYLLHTQGTHDFKVGYASTLWQRMVAYPTHNPRAVLLETIRTKPFMRHKLETAVHEYIAKRDGWSFINGTEWFEIDGNVQEFIEKGFSQFPPTAKHVRTIYEYQPLAQLKNQLKALE